MIRASNVGRRMILVLGLLFVLLAAFPAWKSFQVFWSLREARRHISQGSPKEAIPLLEKLAENAPARVDLQYLLGVAHRRAGNVTAARPFFRRARELHWPSEDIDRQERLLMVQTGQTKLAEALLEVAAREDTSDDVAAETYEALAVGYLMAYQLQEAERCLLFWIEWQPEAIPPRLLFANLLKREERTQEAMRAYAEILAIDPEQREGHMEYAILLLEGNRIQEAFAHFNYCAQVDPLDPEARLGLAECYNRMGQTQESRQALEFVLQHSDVAARRAVALVELGRLAIKDRNHEEAIEHLEAALKIEPRDPAAHYTLGSALAKLNRLDEARQEFDLSKQLRTKINRVAEINDSLSGEPGNVDLRYESGMILMDLGLDRQGVSRLRTVFLYDPRHRKTHEALAAYFEKEGNAEQAASHRQSLAALHDAEGATGTPAEGNGATGVQAVPPLPVGTP